MERHCDVKGMRSFVFMLTENFRVFRETGVIGYQVRLPEDLWSATDDVFFIAVSYAEYVFGPFMRISPWYEDQRPLGFRRLDPDTKQIYEAGCPWRFHARSEFPEIPCERGIPWDEALDLLDLDDRVTQRWWRVRLTQDQFNRLASKLLAINEPLAEEGVSVDDLPDEPPEDWEDEDWDAYLVWTWFGGDQRAYDIYCSQHPELVRRPSRHVTDPDS